MFKKILSQLQEFGDIIDWLLRLGAVVAMASSIITITRIWIKLDKTDLWLIGITIFGLLLIGLSILFRWLKNNSVKNIPNLLIQMDEKVKCLIGTAKLKNLPNSDVEQFIKDVGELWDIDLQRLKRDYIGKDIMDIKEMIKESENKPSPFPQSSPQPFTIISNVLQTLWGLMKTDKVGVDVIKDIEYKKLERRLDTLQKRLRDSRSIRNLDRYLMWWNGSNHYFLAMRYGEDNPMYSLVAPPKVKAILPQFEYLLHVALNEYLGYVKDSIYGKKMGKEEWKPIDESMQNGVK